MSRARALGLSGLCAALLSAGAAGAQDFDAARGYIFDQPFVQRIDPRRAEALLGGREGHEALRQFETFAWLKAAEPPLPAGLRRQGAWLEVRAGRKPALRLRDHVPPHPRDDADRQQFVYLRTVAGYHLIAVKFDHDAPHALLVATQSPAVYFVNSETLAP